MLLINDNIFDNMKKIKLLHVFVLGLIAIFILFFIGNTYVIFFSEFMDQFKDIYDDFIFGYYTQFVGLFFSVISFIGLIYIRKGLKMTLKNGVFNSESSQNFVTAGKYFFVSGILGCIFEFAIFFNSGGPTAFGSFGQNFLLIILAFVLNIIAIIIKNGNDLKIDNELTV